MKDIDHVPASGFGDLLWKSLAICAVTFLILYLTVLDGHAQDAPLPCACSTVGYQWATPTQATRSVWVWYRAGKPIGEFASRVDLVYAERAQKAADLVRRINEGKVLTVALQAEMAAFMAEIGAALK